MDSATAMTVVIIIAALALLGWFATAWLKDRNRSSEEAQDSGRLDTDTDGRGTSGPPSPPGT